MLDLPCDSSLNAVELMRDEGLYVDGRVAVLCVAQLCYVLRNLPYINKGELLRFDLV
jgi:hypothetical protein